MSTQTNPRRSFLRLAGAAVAGAPIVASAEPGAARPAAKPPAAGILDVKAFGATGDGKTLDTVAINKAIDAAAAAGGGTVRFPAGDYLSYSIHLKSHIALHLEPGATIIAADPPAAGAAGFDLPEPNEWDMFQDFGHSHFHNSLIWGDAIENIAITGTGRIWGRGLSKGYGPGPDAHAAGVGNKSISLKNCRDVLLRDFSILHGGHFGILATGVENLTIDNLKIDTNRDGMDVDACRNVRISNCYVNSPWDDGICLKADYSLGQAKQTELVTITNCYVSGCWEEGSMLDGTYKKFGPDAGRVGRTGRIKFGTESNGGFRNITISNCVFEGCQGLALESVDGAILEDITVTNISMRDIVSAPIFLRLGSRMRGPDNTPVGTLRRVIISNLVCSNCVSGLGSIISGIPGYRIEDVKISNIQILHQGGGTREDAAYRPPEYEDMYPEPTMFVGGPRSSGRGPDGRWHAEGSGRPFDGQAVPATPGGRTPGQPGGAPAAAGAPTAPGRPAAPGAPGAAGTPGAPGQPGASAAAGGAGRPRGPVHHMPSHGFYVRHVKGIQFDNIEIRAEKDDQRPAFVLEDVEGADFFRVKASQAAGVPAFALRKVSDVAVHMCDGVPDTRLKTVEDESL
jgi:polygalacturonase